MMSLIDLKAPRTSSVTFRKQSWFLSKYHVVPAREVAVVSEPAASSNCAFPIRYSWLISFLLIRWPKKSCRFRDSPISILFLAFSLDRAKYSSVFFFHSASFLGP